MEMVFKEGGVLNEVKRKNEKTT